MSTQQVLAHTRQRQASDQRDEEIPRLANSLSNRLRELRRREDALTAIDEALEVHRRLADARPDAFLPNLSTSLNNQSASLSELGRREDALTAIDEVVTRILPMLQRATYALPDSGRGYCEPTGNA